MYRVVEICAGAGGQSLGLELAGFEHELCIELDPNACATLRHNRPSWKVAQGDVASVDVWDPVAYAGIDLLAGGVPCPPFTIAGRQLGATDERDLFAWAVELCSVIGPRALLLENVRGPLRCPALPPTASMYWTAWPSWATAAEWQLLHVFDYGVPQLRPRFVLIAMCPDDLAHFTWPKRQGEPPTVGETLRYLMATNGWPGAIAWAGKSLTTSPPLSSAARRNTVVPTSAPPAPSAPGGRWVWTRSESRTQPPRRVILQICCPSSPARWSPGSKGGTTASTGGCSLAAKPSNYRQIGNDIPAAHGSGDRPADPDCSGSHGRHSLRRQASSRRHTTRSTRFSANTQAS